MVIAGSGLIHAATITVGGVKVTAFTVNSDKQVTFTVPTGARLKSRPYNRRRKSDEQRRFHGHALRIVEDSKCGICLGCGMVGGAGLEPATSSV